LRLNDKYDIVVVGAGPAGSMAARAAARSGANVLLLDRRREIGVPVQCGEALSEDPLKDLGIKPDPRWIAGRTNAVKIVSPSGIAVRISEKKIVGKMGYILDRKVFDKHLAMLAAKEGADVRVGTVVDGLMMENDNIKGIKAHGIEGRLEFLADVVIAADGVGSRIARWAGINTALKLVDIESGAQFQMVGIDFESSSTMEFYLGSKIAPGGYAWIFPKGEDMANVGLGVLGSRAERPAIEYLQDFVKRAPGLQKGKIIEINAGGVPVGGPIKRTVKDNLLIVGDAARQVNALTGGGIDYAMRAGDIAGDERYLKAKNVLISLSDEDLDELAKALSKIKFENISLTAMLKSLLKAHPKLLWKLRGLV
jgi:digeranylgeranylglycerophospholipid reductase